MRGGNGLRLGAIRHERLRSLVVESGGLDASVVRDVDGTVRRCHFIREPLGNIYEGGFESSLRARPCTNGTCGCHIGYVHMPDLGLYRVFGRGVLERVPEELP